MTRAADLPPTREPIEGNMIRRRILFADRDLVPGPVPRDAIAYWRKKGLQVGFDHRDVWAEEHDAAFTAAKVMREDVLRTLQSHLDLSLEQGLPFRDFVSSVRPELESQGWWGEHEVVDPQTGKVAKVNPPRRLALIYDTNMRMARAAGQFHRIQAEKPFRPYLLYTIGPSANHREQHVAWHGLLLPADDPFWTFAFPPNGYGCKCGVRSVSQREYKDLVKSGIVEGEPEPVFDEDGLPTGHVVQKRVPVKTKAPEVPLVPWLNKRTGQTILVREGIDPGFDRVPTLRGKTPPPTPVTPPPPPVKPKRTRKPKTPKPPSASIPPPAPPPAPPSPPPAPSGPLSTDPSAHVVTYKRRGYGDESAAAIAWGRAMHERGRELSLADAQSRIARLQARGVRSGKYSSEVGLINDAIARLTGTPTPVTAQSGATLGDLLDGLLAEKPFWNAADEELHNRLHAWAAFAGHHDSVTVRTAPLPFAVTQFRKAGRLSKARKAQLAASMDRGLDLYRALADETVHFEPGYVVYYDPSRGYHNGQKKEISSGRPEVYAHEVAHALELWDHRLHARAQDFLTSRTAGEAAQRLSVLTGDPYPAYEIAKPDKFIDHYIGKIYPNGRASEVTTMGVQTIVEGEAHRMVEKDLDFFYLVLGQLAGGKVP